HQLVLMHGNNAGEGNGEVVAQAHFAVSGVREVVHQLLVLSGFAGEDFHVLENWRIQRFEPVGFEHSADAAHHFLAQQHLLRKVIPESLQDLWFSCGCHVVLRQACLRISWTMWPSSGPMSFSSASRTALDDPGSEN